MLIRLSCGAVRALSQILIEGPEQYCIFHMNDRHSSRKEGLRLLIKGPPRFASVLWALVVSLRVLGAASERLGALLSVCWPAGVRP